VLLAVMETIADFGTVAYFGVQTYATGIYASFILLGDRAGASQLALGLLAFALLLVWLERISRGGGRVHSLNRRQESLPRMVLTGWPRAVAVLFCLLPMTGGALLPLLILGTMAPGAEQDLLGRRYMGFIGNSLTLATVAALVTVSAAVALSYFHRLRPGPAARGALSIGRLGYAVPGGVIAVGLLVPFAAFDNALDAFMEARFDISTGLLFTGSIWLLVMAYMIRFMAAALGAYEGGQAQLNPNLDAASRMLGQRALGTLWRVHLPILTPSLLTATLIVFVDVMKELPATLIMRPFNFDTLAVQAYRLASDERVQGAAAPSLLIVAVGLLPVILICRQIGQTR
jgi:iron(III) transport system permease protein